MDNLKDEAYKALGEIKLINFLVRATVKHNMQNVDFLVSRLKRMEDLGNTVLAYCLASNDKTLKDEISKISRFVFHRFIVDYCHLGEAALLPVVLCNRALYEAVRGCNEKHGTKALEAHREPSTEQAKKYFVKAIEAGFMEKTDTGYKWIFGGKKGVKAALAYFLMKVYNPDNTQTIPFKELESLFGVSRLDSSYSGMLTVGKPQNWRRDIDKLFEE